MAFLGRESAADTARAERYRAWARARSPYALFAVLFGTVSVIDSITMVIGLACGIVALVLGVLGLRDLERNPTRLGHRLCVTAMGLGMLGIGLSGLVWWLLH